MIFDSGSVKLRAHSASARTDRAQRATRAASCPAPPARRGGPPRARPPRPSERLLGLPDPRQALLTPLQLLGQLIAAAIRAAALAPPASKPVRQPSSPS